MSDLTLGRDRLNDTSVAFGREWLVTNGIGGFAAGTVSGALTRRYHGLLFAALDPPHRRTLLLAKLAERIGREGEETDLTTDLWASGAIAPRGHRHLLSFHLEDTIPVWTWAVAGTRLEKRVWMEQGENTTCIQYTLVPDSLPVTLRLRVLADHRDLHTLTRRPEWTPEIETVADGLSVRMHPGAAPLHVVAPGAEIRTGGDWFRDYLLPVERDRGFDAVADVFMAGELSLNLVPGERTLVVASTRPGALAGPLALAAARSRRLAHDRGLLEAWTRARPDAARDAPAWVRRLVLAADAYLAAAPGPEARITGTVVAGYPWFTDWARDALIALPGLALATGRADRARAILKNWARHAERGRMPDCFDELGLAADTRAADAPLWLFQAVRATFEATRDRTLLAELFPVLEDIGAWYERGDRSAIGVDPRDGLIRAAADGQALTWMDARVNGEPVTSRAGKPVELSALWYNALTAMAGFARKLGRPADAYAQMARRVRHSFERFWNPETGGLFDVIDGPRGADPSVRPNQLLAISLPDTPLAAARRRAVLEVCSRSLFTPFGLRSLAPDDDRYRGRYEGDAAARDGAYHQGAAWVWLLPHLALAHYRVHGDRAEALALLDPLEALLARGAIGHLPELVDGDAPHEPRGAIAQAWSVGEALRAWHALHAAPAVRPVGRGGRTLRAVGPSRERATSRAALLRAAAR